MKAMIFPEADGKQRVTFGGVILGYVRQVPGGWAGSTLSGEHIAYELGVVDAVRAVVAYSYPQIMVEVVEEEVH